MRKFLIYFLLFVSSPVFGDAKVDYDVNNVSLRGRAEDYEYLAMLDSLAGNAKTTEIVSPIVSDFQHYSNNPETYLAARKQIAAMIEAQSK